MNKFVFIIAILIGGICFSIGMEYGENASKNTIQESAYIKE